jgi:PAS domain S-box-containing protein
LSALDIFCNLHCRDIRYQIARILMPTSELAARLSDSPRESKRQLEALKYALDAAAIVARTDRAGKITFVNDKFCEISGYDREELIGQDHRILNSGVHPHEFMRELWRTIGQGHVWRGEIQNRAKLGHLYWVDTTIVPLPDADGKHCEYIAIRFDITSRKAAESRLRDQAALTQLGEMATMVAHEVRNPLAGLTGALQILGERFPADSEERMVVGDMRERIRALNATLTDLLTYARPHPMRRADHDLLEVVENVVAGLRADARFTGLQIEVGGAPATCHVDLELMRGLLLNLALNAAQAMNGRGRLQILVEPEGQVCVVRVIDNGPGISAQVRNRVFEPFFTTKSRGTGLGLAIVRRVVEQHEGEVILRSPESGGTEVRISLPGHANLP